MSADEIVNALCRTREVRIFGNDQTQLMADAADLLESQQAQLADYHHMSELVDGKMEENQRLRRINENLTARAEKAKAERDTYRAALEALHISTDLLEGE